ncbi:MULTISPECIES: TetR/AcrR family transcriptional regulator [unclassified Nesterenkonia]|uniref:TetR/AcrR family transcriptional regulator n=1 Tax=unclassified Nesterenkonia TaxID=2629769 RepID=UPI0008732A83|nr:MULTISPECIES: TetR family transcriptional regulator [unclassified Nesterenkonia]MDS2172693.1 TetR family transcriptional regulator [Nesterenkonia sp. CL21]OSM43994.1 hypothetical protein BCY76_004690 [Nesterenkonia sp. PF2B19]
MDADADPDPQPGESARYGKGRRAGRPDTKGQILAAARESFAEAGYEKASLRGIAARAGVDPALVHHYFGTKEKLFAAAVDVPFDPQGVAAAVQEAPLELRGRRLVHVFLGVWDDPVRRAPLLALLRAAMSQDSASALLRGFGRRVMVARIAQGMTGEDRELRAEAAVAQLFGLVIARHVLRIEPMASASVQELEDLVGPVIQQYFD